MMDLKDLSKIDTSQLLKNKNLLANAGIIILAFIITVNLHRAQVKKINALKGKIAQENEITVSLDEIKTLEEQIDELKGDFPVGLSSDVVIEKVSSIARKNNTKISSIDSQAMVDRELYQLLPLRIDIKTDYHNLGHFISDIEQTGIFKPKRLSVKTGRKGTKSNFSLEIIAITLKK